MFRNLMLEFKADHSVSPIDPSRKSLGDDWMVTRFINHKTAQSHNVAPELLRVQIRFVLDSAHRLSSHPTDTPGRIVYISLPEIRGSKVHEITRGMSLGEAYDLAKCISDDDLMTIICYKYKSVLMSPDEYTSHIESQNQISELKSGAGHPARQGGSYAFREIRGQRTLVWISDETARAEKEHYEQVTARSERRQMVFMVRGIIRDCLKNDDDLQMTLSVITNVMAEQGDESIVTEALQTEMKSLQTRMEAAKERASKPTKTRK